MRIIESTGPFRYQIEGADEQKEQSAANYLEEALERLSHDFTGNFYDRWQDAQYIAKNKYGVTIRIYKG